jgi:hypothetical protein
MKNTEGRFESAEIVSLAGKLAGEYNGASMRRIRDLFEAW